MYVKLIDGRLQYAPKKIMVEDTTVYNPTGEQLAAQGWKPLVTEEMPEPREGYHFEPEYTETDDAIVQSWAEVENPPEEPDPDEILNILTGGES